MVVFCSKIWITIVLFHITFIKGKIKIKETILELNDSNIFPLENQSETENIFMTEYRLQNGYKKTKCSFHIELSHLYGKVLQRADLGTFHLMNNYTKVILSDVFELIEKLEKEYKKREIPLWIYEKLLDRFAGLKLTESKNNFFQTNLPTKTEIAGKYIKDHFLKMKIKSWLTKLIRDKDILLASFIDEKLILQDLSRLETGFQNWKSIFYHKLNEKQELVDAGLVRFPDFEAPFFLLYKLRVTLNRTTKKYLMFYQIDKTRLYGSITVQRYIPNKKTKRF